MGTYLEAGVGKAVGTNGRELGRSAATEALTHLQKFEPSIAFVFVSSELDIPAVSQGTQDILGGCPTIGTSTAGEIANGLVTHGIAVAVIASPHVKVRVGMGEGVSRDPRGAIFQALEAAGASDYFSAKSPQHQMLQMAAPGAPAVSPVVLVVFSPGSTTHQLSLSHDIHTILRKASANRIPIVGGGSGDYFQYEENFQMVNGRVSSDGIALAFIETEILFGLGLAHGCSPTTKRALVTRHSGHLVHELDGRPAAEVYAQFLGIPLERLMDERSTGPHPLEGLPFGTVDMHGNSVLHVPERVLRDGSIVFPYLMSDHQVITLMEMNEDDVIRAGLSAYDKALSQGGLNNPTLALMFSGALRMLGHRRDEETRLVRERSGIPLCGFYGFGQTGISDDGVPVYSNQSVCVVVFSDELNPIASLMHTGKRMYIELTSRLTRKAAQLKSINRINQIIQDSDSAESLFRPLVAEFTNLFPWAAGAFYLSDAQSPGSPGRKCMLAFAVDKTFPQDLPAEVDAPGWLQIGLESHGRFYGNLILKGWKGAGPLDEEDLALVETIGKLVSRGLHRIELDAQMDLKLLQLGILNRMAVEFSKSISPLFQLQNVIKHVRNVLGLSYVSLWHVDGTHRLVVQELLDSDPDFQVGEAEKAQDESLMKWQIEHQEAVYVDQKGEGPEAVTNHFPYSHISLPVSYKNRLRGVLNFYSSKPYAWPLQRDRLLENMEFLKSIATEAAVIIEVWSLQQHATFFKEIHHRVKNNLQNIASLLALQLRRTDDAAAKEALASSISRITAIAVVHESLSQEETAMVELGRLVRGVSKLAEVEPSQDIVIGVDVSGPSVLIPSREATYLALIINELIQNSLKHGVVEGQEGRISIRAGVDGGVISVFVQDNGPGLAAGFDPDCHGNLGLTIVRNMVKDELKGQFSLVSEKGVLAEVTFPPPQTYRYLGEPEGEVQ
jgi:two-component sensor histidine kinase